MDKASFHDLCERLAPMLEGGHTNYKESLSVQKKVAVSLSRLAGEVVPYRVHAMIFGIAPSTACKVFKDFVFAVIEVGVLFPLCKIVFAYHTSSIIILQIMRSEFVKHPSGQRMATIKAAFARKGFPNCLGALDGTHFKIAAPTYLQNYEDYYCLRKGSHTSQMQAVCDHDCIFWDVVLGRPGSVHDSRVLTNSNLYLKHQQILGDSLATLSSGDTVTPYILADGGYPNFEWLITVFPGDPKTLSERERHFLRGREGARLRRAGSLRYRYINARTLCLIFNAFMDLEKEGSNSFVSFMMLSRIAFFPVISAREVLFLASRSFKQHVT